jgi:hypothetical protein
MPKKPSLEPLLEAPSPPAALADDVTFPPPLDVALLLERAALGWNRSGIPESARF